MEGGRGISLAVIKRLPRYYRYLGNLIDNDINRISSKELSKIMNITASQIRQDLNNFGCFGQQGYGYDVNLLYLEIKKILGLHKFHHMIIVGAGNIGQALANYSQFEARGFKFIGIFDSNPKLVNMTIRDIKVYDVDFLEEFLQENVVDIVALTLPKEGAIKVSSVVSRYSIKGIWNFSNIDLDVPASIVVENVHLTDSLMTLSYKLNEKEILESVNNMKF